MFYDGDGKKLKTICATGQSGIAQMYSCLRSNVLESAVFLIKNMKLQ